MSNVEKMQRNPEATRDQLPIHNQEKLRIKNDMETLRNLGVFKRVNDQELYHGRATDRQTEWNIDPFFNNGGNNSGNNNINKITALNAGNYRVAKDFGEVRAQRTGKRFYEVHKIESPREDDYTIDAGYHSVTEGMSQLQKSDYYRCMRDTLPSLTQACIFSFEDGKSINQDNLRFLEDHPYQASEIPKIARMLNISEEGAEQIVGSYNARYSIVENPNYTMMKLLSSVDDQNEKQYPINYDYVARWVDRVGLTGATYRVNSATLGETIDTTQFFRLDKITTPEQEQRREQYRHRVFGRAAMKAAKLLGEDERRRKNNWDVMSLLERDQHASPQEIVDAAKRFPRYKQIFEMDTGVWEGYTLQQHTETALDIFEKSYADRIPASLYTVGQLALLTHDIGKPLAAANGERSKQASYNREEAKVFMRGLNIDENMQNFIINLIGPGMEAVSQHMLDKKDRSKLENAGKVCSQIAQYFHYDETQPTDINNTQGIYDLCKALVTADGGAYSSYSSTLSGSIRHKGSGGGSGDFDKSFHATGPAQDRIHFK